MDVNSYKMKWMYLYFYVQVCEGFFIFVFISVTTFYSKHKASFSGWILDPVKEDPRYHSNLRRLRSWTLVWPVHQMENRASVRRGKFRQQTGSKWGRNNRFRDMGFFPEDPHLPKSWGIYWKEWMIWEIFGVLWTRFL